MSAQCAKPACSEPIAAWFLTNREAQEVVVVPEPDPHAIGLCERHLARLSVPTGWTLRRDADSSVTDSVGTTEPSAERRPWFAPDIDEQVPGPIETPEPGSLLERAFAGPTEIETRRLARLERIDDEVDRTPQRLGRREEHDREDDSDREAHQKNRTNPQVWSRNGHHDEQRGHHEREGGHRVDAYGTNELPFPPFEPEFAARAAIG